MQYTTSPSSCRLSRSFLLLVFFLLFLLPSAIAQENAATPAGQAMLVVFLTNGDRVSGTVLAIGQEQVELENKYAGRFHIALKEIKAWQTAEQELRTRLSAVLAIKDNDTLAREALEAKEKTRVLNAKTASTSPSKTVSQAVKPDAWKRQVNFAYTMTRGNINSSDINAAFNLTRKYGSRQVAVTSFGRYGVNNGRQSANLISSTFRFERTAFQVPIFSETQFEIDKLKNLDYRVTKNLGFSYPVLKGDTRNLAFDFGTGVTKEDYETGLQKLNASSLVRLKASQKLSERTVLNQQATIFSDLTDPGAYRIQAEASMTTPITKHLALRLAGINRFDARPQGFAKPNDFTLLTGFTFDF